MMNFEVWEDLPTGDLDLFNLENSSDDQSDGQLDLYHLDNISDDQSDGSRRCGCAEEGTWDGKDNLCWSILPNYVIWHSGGTMDPKIRHHAKECYYFQETKKRKKRPRRKTTISEEPADTPRTDPKRVKSSQIKLEGGGPSPTMDL